ncbi:MAG: hypothetical protein IPH18_09515 [Chitinophagaceae bacterium]|nr:hypothetical protein [Chitinophagaceae bacterium]
MICYSNITIFHGIDNGLDKYTENTILQPLMKRGKVTYSLFNKWSAFFREEKVPSGNSLTEEFLHEFHATTLFFSIASKSYKCHDAETYIAFHGELLVPPPNFS